MKKLDYVYESKAEYPEALNRFLTDLSENESAKNTIEQYECNLREFLRVISKIKKWSNKEDVKNIEIKIITNEMIDNIILEDIEEYLKYCLKKKTQRSDKNSSATRNHKISTLDTFYKFLMRSKIVKANLINGIKRPKLRRKEREPLSEDEAKLLLSTIKDHGEEYIDIRDYTIFALFLNTGMRLDEVRQLDIQDLKLDKGILRTVAKGEYIRDVDIPDNCIEILREYLKERKLFIKEKKNKIEDSDALFYSRLGNKVSSSTIYKNLKDYAEMAGLDKSKVSPHVLRHTTFTTMVNNGVPINVIQKQAGHKNINTTIIYTKLNNKETKKAVNGLNFI